MTLKLLLSVKCMQSKRRLVCVSLICNRFRPIVPTNVLNYYIKPT